MHYSNWLKQLKSCQGLCRTGFIICSLNHQTSFQKNCIDLIRLDRQKLVHQRHCVFGTPLFRINSSQLQTKVAAARVACNGVFHILDDIRPLTARHQDSYTHQWPKRAGGVQGVDLARNLNGTICLTTLGGQFGLKSEDFRVGRKLAPVGRHKLVELSVQGADLVFIFHIVQPADMATHGLKSFHGQRQILAILHDQFGKERVGFF